jgi:hypothetical protein
MANKKKPIEIKITKFYLLAWVFGLLSLLAFWKNWNVTAVIFFLIFVAYSRADCVYPVDDDDKGNDDLDGTAF